ncbi:hypothetical protein [Glycomyces sp. NRRL B-16210]|uniref:hypothetical protein n=1 Tax=Glycomyces sp. NRRL B-16210 TaxID=1463821 RepID=UPI0004BEB231|nr:hypothetical protein [Glycomyces sp. NRRL B-16210]
MSDKFNEIKDKVADNADDLKDKAGELYNKAKESPAGEKMGGPRGSARRFVLSGAPQRRLRRFELFTF